MAITYNNLACYYKSIDKPRSALIYLEKALEIESTMQELSFKADTHLNTCAVLSMMKRHDLAKDHAQNAIMIVQASLLKELMPQMKSAAGDQKKMKEDSSKVHEL